jgi:hypothetical protein
MKAKSIKHNLWSHNYLKQSEFAVQNCAANIEMNGPNHAMTDVRQAIYWAKLAVDEMENTIKSLEKFSDKNAQKIKMGELK